MTEKKASTWPTGWDQDVAGNLARPFHPDVVKWRPGSQSNGKAMALAYIDARDVMDRLDQCVGPSGWSAHFVSLNDDRNAVSCALTVLGVTKQDVGYPNGRNDEEPYKAAFSDALKRAAVHFGIGRELYDTPQFWLPLVNGRFQATPTYVVGKGWVAPGQEPQREQRSPASGGSKASDTMRKKVFAVLREAGLETVEDIKAFTKPLTGKDSSKEWTVADIDLLIKHASDMKKVA